jgi:hypothetical protein
MNQAKIWAYGKDMNFWSATKVNAAMYKSDRLLPVRGLNGEKIYEFGDNSAIVIVNDFWYVREESCKRACFDSIGCMCERAFS